MYNNDSTVFVDPTVRDLYRFDSLYVPEIRINNDRLSPITPYNLSF